MRVTMVAWIAAGSLLGVVGAAHAGVPLGGLAREPAAQPIMVAQAATPNMSSGATSVGTATPPTSASSPAPTATGAPLTAGAVNQSNNGLQSLPPSALPATTEPVPPTTSSIAPQPAQPTNGFSSQSAAPMSSGLFKQFNNVPESNANGSLSVAAPYQAPTAAPSTNGGANPNVPGWDHP